MLSIDFPLLQRRKQKTEKTFFFISVPLVLADSRPDSLISRPWSPGRGVTSLETRPGVLVTDP
jgi:hypothetical protein